jgi:hypothetical protein
MQLKCSNQFAMCAVAVLLAAPSVLLAQVADVPIKAGLWDTQINVKIGSVSGGHDTPVSRQMCFTAGMTVASYMSALNRSAGADGAHCTVSNKVQTAHGLSYDSACTGGAMSTKGHADFQLPDADHFSGSSHTTVTGSAGGNPVNTTVDKTFSAKFLSSNCGNVQPTVIPPAK